ncbi:L-lactate dehydrogenase, partial [Dermatophilus congolensis]
GDAGGRICVFVMEVLAVKYVPNRVVLIGTGAVGMAYAYAVVNQGICEDLVLIDLNETKSRADVLDLNHGEAWAPAPVHVTFGDYSACKDAAMVVICAGAAQKPGQTRLDLIDTNLKIYSSVVSQVMASGFDGIFLVATNPVDILTFATYRFSGLPREQVLGSGTTLDTARLRFHLGRHFEVSTANVHATIIGEHGDSELPVWSSASVAGRSLSRQFKNDPQLKSDLDEIFERTRKSAYEIIDAKGSTSYGIGMSLARVTRAILKNEKATMPVSAILDGEYGQEGVAIGVPAILSRGGVKHIVELDLDEEERAAFEQSVSILKTHYDEATRAE